MTQKTMITTLILSMMKILGLMLFGFGSIINVGGIVTGYSGDQLLATTYLSYESVLNSVLFSLFGSVFMSITLILQIEHFQKKIALPGIVFLGLLIVNIIRLLTLPPDWGVWPTSGYTLVMFELSTGISIVLLLLGLSIYSISRSFQFTKKESWWYLWSIVSFAWVSLLIFISALFLIASPHQFGLGFSGTFMMQKYLLLIPLGITAIAVLIDDYRRTTTLKKSED